MATSVYPKIGTKAWSTLRAKAEAAPTTKFTPDLVATLMDMSSPDSALSNTVRPMRTLGLLDEDGALTERGHKWRVDASFPGACQEILDEVYPDDLGALVHDDGSPDQESIKSWFALQGFGETNARKMAVTYVFIARKTIPNPPGSDSAKTKSAGTSTKRASGKPPKPKKPEKTNGTASPQPPEPPLRSDGGPNIHLDIQIHIPADASPEQIDQIFSSMAKHLYAK